MGRKIKAKPPMGAIARYEHKRRVEEDQSQLAVITPQMALKVAYKGSGRTWRANHDPVLRWADAGRLTPTQLVVIEWCQRLWRLAGLNQRVTASYGERMPGGGGTEHRTVSEIEAREDLHRVQGYVPQAYFDVFENVCRHGLAAGVAGASLGYGTRSAQDRAHMIVVFVCDVIAMRERM